MSTEIETKVVKILVTGASGFIGSHLMNSLLTKEYDLYCIGVDNFNNYYDPQLKKDRCEEFGLEIRNCDLNDFEKRHVTRRSTLYFLDRLSTDVRFDNTNQREMIESVRKMC